MVKQILPSGTIITASNRSDLEIGIRQFMALGTVPKKVSIEYPAGHEFVDPNPSQAMPDRMNPDAEIVVRYIDHDTPEVGDYLRGEYVPKNMRKNRTEVEKEIKFETRKAYKDWRIANQKIRKASLGTSHFRILAGFLNEKTKRQDLADTLRLLAKKKSEENRGNMEELLKEGKLSFQDLLGN